MEAVLWPTSFLSITFILVLTYGKWSFVVRIVFLLNCSWSGPWGFPSGVKGVEKMKRPTISAGLTLKDWNYFLHSVLEHPVNVSKIRRMFLGLFQSSDSYLNWCFSVILTFNWQKNHSYGTNCLGPVQYFKELKIFW